MYDIVASATLRHFFPMLEQSGTKITDIKGGVVWDVATGGKTLQFDSVKRTVKPMLASADDPIPLASGAWSTFTETQSILVVAAGEVSNAVSTHVRLAIGDTNNTLLAGQGGIGMAGNPFHLAMRANSDTGVYQRLKYVDNPRHPLSDYLEDRIAEFYDTTTYDGNDHALVATYVGSNSSVNGRYRASQLNNWSTVLDTNIAYEFSLDAQGLPVTWSADPSGGLTPAPSMRFAGMKLYGYAVFAFDNGLPNGWEDMVRWTVSEWQAGRRHIHPGLL